MTILSFTSRGSCPRILAQLTFAVFVATGVVSTQGCSSDSVAGSGDAGTSLSDASTSQQDGAIPIDAGQSIPDSGKDSGPTTAAEIYCAAVASHATCAGQTPSTCDESGKCIFGKMLPESAVEYSNCHSAPSCKSQDTCVIAAGKLAGGSAATQFATDCANRLTACPKAFDDENCNEAPFAWPGIGAAAQACLAKPCEEIDACMKSLGATLKNCK